MTLYDQVDSNKRRSTVFIGLFLILVIFLGWLFSYIYNSPVILWLAVIISVVQALVSFYSGDKIALSSTGAEEIQKKDSPELWRVVENLTITAGLPMPKVYIINDPSPNAFATGRDPEHASIAVTTGLLQALNKQELEGVIAHELSHVGNYDIRLSMIVVVLVGVIAIVSDIFLRSRIFGFGDSDDNNNGSGFVLLGIVAAILAPIAASLIQLAISRKREYLADTSGALLTRYPEGLASALEKIGRYNQPMEKASTATSHLFIASPFGKAASSVSKLFSTHPPIEDRIKLLREMSI